MAQPAANLRVRISADLNDIKSGLGLLRGELAKVKAQSAAALPGNQNAFISGVRRARAELAGFIGAYLSLRGVGVLAGIADEATQIRGRIRAAKGDYEALFKIAQDTRQGLGGTVDLYARMERGTRSMGIGQQKLLTLTRAVNQAIRLSFTSVASGEAAVMQFGQALAAGELRGDELNSVLEQTPRLAEAVAAGMGLQVGELKKLAKEGKLAASEVLKAVLSQSDVLEKEAKQIPDTIGSALVQVRNAFLDYIGDQDEATGSSRKFAAALQEISKDLPKYLDPVLKAVTLLLQNFDVLVVFILTRMVAAAIPALISGFAALRTAILAARTAALTLEGALALLGGPIGIALAALAAAVYLLYKNTTQAEAATTAHNEALAESNRLSQLGAGYAKEYAQQKAKEAAETLKAAQAKLIDAQAYAAQLAARTPKSGSGEAVWAQQFASGAAEGRVTEAQKAIDQARGMLLDWQKEMARIALETSEEAVHASGASATGATADINKAVAASNALLRDSIARALKDLDRLYAENEIGIEAYFAGRADLQEKAIDADIAQARAELAVTKEVGARRKIEEDIIKLQRDRAEVSVEAAREQKKAEEELTKQLGEVKIRLMELDGNTAAAERANLETQYLDLFKRLDAASDATGRKMVENLIDRLVAKSKLDELRGVGDRITNALQGKETSVSAQVSAGTMGRVEGDEALYEARSAALEQMLALRNTTVETLATMDPSSPEAAAALSFLGELDGNIADVVGSMDTLRNQVKDVATDAVTNLFMDLVEGSKSAGEALRDFVRNFALAMAQIAARALATMLVLQLLDAIWPGAGKMVAAAGGASAGVLHAGGIAGSVGRIRTGLNTMLFGAAPRYHGGGIAGLAPDEVPAVLQKGEEVLTRNDPRHRNNGGAAGGSGERVATPIVAIGDAAIADAMSSAAGTRAILTVVRRNWGGLSQGR